MSAASGTSATGDRAAGPLSARRSVAAAWARMGPGKRVAVVLVGAALIINLGLAALRSLVGGGEPGGPTSSSFSTGSDGFAGWADLLARHDHAVTRQRETPAKARLDPASTLILADPQQLEDADVRTLLGFLDAGGRLVLAGAAATPVLSATSGQAVRWSSAGASQAEALVPVGRGADVSRVDASGRGSYLGAGGLLPVLARNGRVIAVAGPAASGWVVGLADSGVVQNRLLARSDNAAWALAAVGPPGRPVVFAESVHGFGEATGLGALPASWRWTGAGLAVAAVAMLWAYGQRFGPVEQEQRVLRPPRRDYVDALAADLVRIKPPRAETAEPLMVEARGRLAAWLGMPLEVDDDALRTGAAHAGLDPSDVDRVLIAPVTDAQVLDLARAAIRLRRVTERPNRRQRA